MERCVVREGEYIEGEHSIVEKIFKYYFFIRRPSLQNLKH